MILKLFNDKILVMRYGGGACWKQENFVFWGFDYFIKIYIFYY